VSGHAYADVEAAEAGDDDVSLLVLAATAATLALLVTTVRLIRADEAGRSQFPEPHAPEIRDLQLRRPAWQDALNADRRREFESMAGTGGGPATPPAADPEWWRRLEGAADLVDGPASAPSSSAGRGVLEQPTWDEYAFFGDLETAEDRWSVEAGRCRYVVSRPLYGPARRMCAKRATVRVEGLGEPIMFCDEHFRTLHGTPGPSRSSRSAADSSATRFRVGGYTAPASRQEHR
jgi:hypothetical protein